MAREMRCFDSSRGPQPFRTQLSLYLIKEERCKVEYYVRFFLLAPIIHLPREGNTTV